MASLDHLVIDEAQDFGPVEFAIMMSAVSDKRQITKLTINAVELLSATIKLLFACLWLSCGSLNKGVATTYVMNCVKSCTMLNFIQYRFKE